jgi:hypothetical protein
MKRPLLIAFACLLTYHIQAQQSQWDSYNKTTASGKELIRVNNLLYDAEPVTKTPFLVKITHYYTGGGVSKLPTKPELASLVKIQEANKKLLCNKTETNLAGAAYHNKECDIYLYVADTTGVRSLIKTYYKKKGYKYALDIKEDYKWDGYFTVLFPTEEERQMIYYKRIAAWLVKSGDKLEKPHKVTYWAYFKSEEDMRTCRECLKNKKFTVTTATKKPYTRCEMRFYHTTPITPEAILSAVKEIKGQLALNGGAYGGWQTIVAVR